MAGLDRDQIRAGRPRDDVLTPMEVTMRKNSARAIAQKVDWDGAAAWSAALWMLAATYLLITVQIF
jgi:hypothetical protein